MFQENLKPSVARSRIHLAISQPIPEDKPFGLHFHRHYELFYALQGDRFFNVGGKEWHLKEGEIIFVGRGVPHSTRAPKNTGGLLLQFDPQPAMPEEIYLPEPAGAAVAYITDQSPLYEELSQCFRRLAAECQQPQAASDLYIRAHTLQIEACLRRAGILAGADYTKEQLAAVLPVLEYCKQHFSEPISLAQASALLNVEKAHFCRLFKKAVGIPFLQYLNRLRIYRAEQLLEETSLSVGEIADRVGFCSAAYFTETFRKVYAMAPRSYRQNRE